MTKNVPMSVCPCTDRCVMRPTLTVSNGWPMITPDIPAMVNDMSNNKQHMAQCHDLPGQVPPRYISNPIISMSL